MPDTTPSLFGPEEREVEQPKVAAPTFSLYVQVALNKPLRIEFTYGIPDGLTPRPVPGARVQVPFGRSRAIGVVVSSSTTAPESSGRVRPVERVLDAEPLVDGELLGLARWLAERYACSWGEALGAFLPAPLRTSRNAKTRVVAEPAPNVGRAELEELEERFPKQHRLLRTLLDAGGPLELRELLGRLNLSESPARTLQKRGWVVLRHVEARLDEGGGDEGAERERPSCLTPAQEFSLSAIGAALEEGEHRTFLLQGVTGSGKTEVYLRAIEQAQALGRGAIVLVPEISLTPQTVGWFRSRFGAVAVLHSRMTDAQRQQAWMRVRRGEVRVVVGARSAIFAPVERLGVVVVDEEHEPSFKQQNSPRYHARDLAVERARRAGAVCLLGSATPSLESWAAARSGEFRHLRLPERVSGAQLPEVEIVDMRTEQNARGRPRLFSRKLESLLLECSRNGEQAILFLNRRGFTRVMYCPACREKVRCEQCSSSLTLHRRIDRAVCHLCCEERVPPTACPVCSAPTLLPFGAGIEQVEIEARSLLPAARVRRMDSDTMLRFEDYTETLGAFGRGEVDVLVGTQMIAKGLDFPRVTLVGIVLADTGLHLPDFRAAERTHQIVSQVSGRAGRGDLAGRIVVQTYEPEAHAILHAARHDFDTFAEEELVERSELGYPPFGRLIRCVFEDESAERARASADRAAVRLREALSGASASILGPAPPPIEMVRGRHRFHLQVKTGDELVLERTRELLLDVRDAEKGVRVTIDVDPQSML